MAAASLVHMILLSLCTNYLDEDATCRLEQFDTNTTATTDKPEEARDDLDVLHYKDLEGKHLRLTTLQKPPLSGVKTDENTGELRGTGIAFDLFHEIQDQAGFTYNITLPEENIVGDTDRGIIKMLKNNEVDMAVVFLPMLQAYRKYVSFSSSLSEFDWVLLMARPSASATGSGLLAPFQKEVWLLILISLIFVGPILYLVIFLRVRLCKNDEEINRFFPLPSCVWFVYGALMKQGSTLSPISDSARLLFATWWIFITILTSFYTANLTAFLTLSQFTLTIETVEDLYTHKQKWMATQGGYTQDIITNEEMFKDLQTMIPAYGSFVDDGWEARLDRAAQGEVYITEKRKATSMMLQDYLNKTEKKIPDKDRCKFVLTPKSIMTQPVAFGYPKNSSLNPVIDPMIMYLVHGGIVTHLLDNDQPLTTICPLNLANSERKLRNSDLSTTYQVVGIGFAFALCAFIGEVTYRFYKNGMTFNEMTPLSVNSGDINKHWKKAAAMGNNKDNFIISHYYNEMITPYKNNSNDGARMRPVFQRVQPGNTFIPNKKSSTIVFQYTH